MHQVRKLGMSEAPPPLPCLFWHVYVLGSAYFVWPWKSRETHVPFVTSHRGHCPLLIRVSCITWRISKLLETYPSYTLRKHVWERVVEGVGEQRTTKAIRCGACYNIVLNAHRVTSMADTGIDAVRKQKKTYTWSGTSIIKDGRYTFNFSVVYREFFEIQPSTFKALCSIVEFHNWELNIVFCIEDLRLSIKLISIFSAVYV
jgi:hypothetical protein